MVTSLPQKVWCEYSKYYLAKRNTHLAHAWCEWTLTPLAYYHMNSRLHNQMFWECNFQAKDVGLVCQAKGFRYSVVKARAECHFHYPNSYQSVLEQIIWFNSHLQKGSPSLTRNNRLRYYTIFNCINRKWHALLHNCRGEIVLDSESKYDHLLSCQKVPKTAMIKIRKL